MQHNMMMSGMQLSITNSPMVSLSSNLIRTFMVVLFTRSSSAQSYYGMPRLYPPRGAPPPGLPPNYMPSIPAQGSTMHISTSTTSATVWYATANDERQFCTNTSVGWFNSNMYNTSFYKQHKHVQCGPTILPPPPLGAANIPPPLTPATPAIPQNAVPLPNTTFAPPPLPAQSSPGATKNIEKQDDANGHPYYNKNMAATLATTTTNLVSNNTTIKLKNLKAQKSSNVIILFRPEHNMSMEEMRALSWRKKQLLSKFM